MIQIEDYVGREQSYVKHVFLESYLERLVHKVASTYSDIAFVDGFAGPWQSENERFEDTSFGIALGALRRAKASWKHKHNVYMSAYLVERNKSAYQRLTTVINRFPDISIRTYQGDFLTVLPTVLRDIPSAAFTFFLVDPKGWHIPLRSLQPMLSRDKAEIVFNFMFDFINRAVNIDDAVIARGLDELIPYGDWRATLQQAEESEIGGLTPNQRKAIIVEAFTASLARSGNYKYVAETTVLRPIMDRPLYCLCYATRHPKGIEVFRDCQIKALTEQSRIRAQTKVIHAELSSGQAELFHSLHEMAPDELTGFLESERRLAERSLLRLTPQKPRSIRYDILWPQVSAGHVVKRADVNQIAAHLRTAGSLLFPDWEPRKQVPQPTYRTQRP